MRTRALLGATLALLSLPLSAQPLPPPPDTPRSNAAVRAHGWQVEDPYRWLEAASPATTQWVEAQADRSDRYLTALPERAAFKTQLESIWRQDRHGVPQVVGGQWFHEWLQADRNQPALWTRRGATGTPRCLVDPNTWSAAGDIAMTQWRVSPDGRYLAYARSDGGADWNTLHIVDVASGVEVPGPIARVKFSDLAWAPDSSGIFYSRYPDTGDDDDLTHQQLMFHLIGTDARDDLTVFARSDAPRIGISGEVSEDGRFLVISLWQGAARENAVRIQPLRDSETPWLGAEAIPLVDRFHARYHFIGNVEDTLYFLTTDRAPRGRIVKTSLGHGQPRFDTVVAESTDTLESASLAGGMLILRYLHQAQHRLTRHGLDGRDHGDIPLPAAGTIAAISARARDPELLFSFTAFNRPPAIWSLRVDGSDAPQPVWHTSAGFDPQDFVTRQVSVSSRDGTRIPMFITHRRGLRPDTPHPTLLYGYGGFGISLTPRFSPLQLAWMARGGVYAVANLRGGGEFGDAWHRAGTGARKQNVFDDFTAAAGFLIDQGWTTPSQLAIHGRSNGGLLVGAVINQHPRLFAAAIPSVGVMDMLRFHRFTIGWAWTGDYGDPEQADDFAVLRAYSPYHNLRRGERYPAVLVTTADHDDRVVPAHSYKYTAALQAAQAGPAPVLLRVDRRAGHGAGKALQQRIEEAADLLAFAWHHTGGD